MSLIHQENFDLPPPFVILLAIKIIASQNFITSQKVMSFMKHPLIVIIVKLIGFLILPIVNSRPGICLIY